MKSPILGRKSVAAFALLVFTLALFGGHSLMFFLFGKNGFFVDAAALLSHDREMSVVPQKKRPTETASAFEEFQEFETGSGRGGEEDSPEKNRKSLVSDPGKKETGLENVDEDPLLASLESENSNSNPPSSTQDVIPAGSVFVSQFIVPGEEEDLGDSANAESPEEGKIPVCSLENPNDSHFECAVKDRTNPLKVAEVDQNPPAVAPVEPPAPSNESPLGDTVSNVLDVVETTITPVAIPEIVPEARSAPVGIVPQPSRSGGRALVGRTSRQGKNGLHIVGGSVSGLIGGMHSSSASQQSYDPNANESESRRDKRRGSSSTSTRTIQNTSSGYFPGTTSFTSPVSSGGLPATGGSGLGGSGVSAGGSGLGVSAGGLGINVGGSGISAGGSGLGLNLGIQIP